MNPSFKKTALAAVVAGTFAVGAMPAAEANVINVSWTGAFTMLSPTGVDTTNAGADYQGSAFYTSGFYGNGAASFGTPKYPANVHNTPLGSTYYPGAVLTSHGWKGRRTPVTGTMSFDTSNGAGVGTVNGFFFFGDTTGAGAGTSIARAVGISFQAIDTVGTIVGTMLFSWNGGGHSVSIVLDGSGMFGSLGTMIKGGPTTSVSGVGALPATNGYNWGTAKAPIFLPLGPSPVATKTLNTGSGCNTSGPIATQVNAYTIVGNPSAIGACTTGMVDDGIGGSPMTSTAFSLYNANFDIGTVHFDSFVPTPTVPIPAAVWLFGSGLLGLVGIARRKKKTS